MLIRNATIYTAVAPEPFVGDVRVCNGKILAVGPNLEAPGEPVVDATESSPGTRRSCRRRRAA